jgi:hypothetical protein
MFSRRDMPAMSAAGAVMTANAARATSFGNPDLPPQGAINAKGPIISRIHAHKARRSAASFRRRNFRINRCRRHAGRLTVFDTGPNAMTMGFQCG